jgi:hypothetical protein
MQEARRFQRQKLIDCLDANMREWKSNSRIVFRTTAHSSQLAELRKLVINRGDRFAVVLDFDCLSRSAPPSKQ